jgi:hypothetical protein
MGKNETHLRTGEGVVKQSLGDAKQLRDSTGIEGRLSAHASRDHQPPPIRRQQTPPTTTGGHLLARGPNRGSRSRRQVSNDRTICESEHETHVY